MVRSSLGALAAVTASALAFALYARVEWPWLVLGWIGLVPWLSVLDRATSSRAAAALGVLMCEAFTLGVFPWFAGAIRGYTGVSWPVAVLVLLLVAPLMQPQLIVFALGRHAIRRRTKSFWLVAVTGACVYVGTEWASPKLFEDTLGHGLYASAWMRQAADLAGASGLTFVLLLANECALRVVQAAGVLPSDETGSGHGARALAPGTCLAVLVIGLLAYGAMRVRQFDGSRRAGERVRAGVVQADISHYDQLARQMGKFDAVRTILDTHFELSSEALQRGTLDLLVWPETVYPTTFGAPKSQAGADFDREIAAYVQRSRVPLIFGAYDADGGDEFNAAFFLEPAADGRVSFETYRKESLFPLTERVPALFESSWLRHWLPWLGSWKPGRGPDVIPLRLPGGRVLRVAPLICYDAVYPSHAIAAVRHGAELIVTLSNDSWFAFGEGPRLHLVVSAFRSIETRRPQVRATNTGISAVITATGELLGTLGVDERATLVETVVPAEGGMTLMLLWGDWFGRVAFVLAAVLLAGAYISPNLRRRY